MDITQRQKEKVEEIAQKYHLKLVLLFGSAAGGRTHRESDIDIAYLSEESLDFKAAYHLNYEFTDVFQNDRVDIVDMKKAPPLLFHAIFQNPQILFSADDIVFFSQQAYAFKKYIESKPLYEEKFRQLAEITGE